MLPSSSLHALVALGRKASSICGESGSHEVIADTAYFLATATHHKAPPTLAAPTSVTTHNTSELYDLHRARAAAGTISVAFSTPLTTTPGAASSVSGSAVHKEMERQLSSLGSTHASVVHIDAPSVWVEDMGEVGAHVVFRNTSVASQWLIKMWRRLETQYACTKGEGGRHRTTDRVVLVHIVYHFTLSHVAAGLMEGPLLQFLQLLDATALSHRAAASSYVTPAANSTGSTLLYILPSVLIEAATPLVASVGREQLYVNMCRGASPRLVVTSVLRRSHEHVGPSSKRPRSDGGGADVDDDVVEDAAAVSTRILGIRSMCSHARNAPLCLFLRDAVALLGVFLERSAMQVLQAAWCVSHSMDDVAMLLHLMSCPFATVLSESDAAAHESYPPMTPAADREQNTDLLFRSISALARYVAVDTYEAQAVAFTCVLDAVAQGSFQAGRDLRALVAAYGNTEGTARAGRSVRVEDLDRIEAAAQRRQSLCWLSAHPWRRAAALASLETPPGHMDYVLAAAPQPPKKGASPPVQAPLTTTGGASALIFSSESEEILASLAAVPSASLRGPMNTAILQRIEPIDDSVKSIRRAAALPSDPSPASVNYFHASVPASVRVMSILTLVGASATSMKGRWVPIERLLQLCCEGDEELLLHAIRQLRVGGLISVNGVTNTARSLLLV